VRVSRVSRVRVSRACVSRARAMRLRVRGPGGAIVQLTEPQPEWTLAQLLDAVGATAIGLPPGRLRLR
jgi:hypothetical protein